MGQPRIALAGTSSFVGAALSEALDARLGIRILTRSMARAAPREGIEIRPCDLFSRNELTAALRGVEWAVYLVHNRDPSARLDQADVRDMDLLVADNFAFAAAQNGVKQIVCRGPLVSNPRRSAARDAVELEEILASRGVPLTVLRTGLVVGPGGEVPRLLLRMLRRLPALPLPALADRDVRPLPLQSLLQAFCRCLGDEDSFGRTIDLFGRETVTLRGMLEQTAAYLGRPPRFISWPGMPEALFADMLRAIAPFMHPEFLDYLLDLFAASSLGETNPVQEAVTKEQPPFRETLEEALRGVRWRKPLAERRQDDEAIRQMGRVRSIQRLHLPKGRNAEWVAERYFPWLGTLMGFALRNLREPDGSWTVRARFLRMVLLRLDFKPDHSSPDRRMYFITAGLLARAVGGRTARLEFRDLLGGRFTIAAIHDFEPALPWHFYRFTQAAFHALVMKGFQGYMEQNAEGGPQL